MANSRSSQRRRSTSTPGDQSTSSEQRSPTRKCRTRLPAPSGISTPSDSNAMRLRVRGRNGELKSECRTKMALGRTLIDSDFTIDCVCPFCDMPLAKRDPRLLDSLPRTSSETLVRMMEHAWENSISTPRTSNPQGRTVGEGLEFPLAVCLQHRYETEIVPFAIAHNWPRHIRFDTLATRLHEARVWEVLRHNYSTPWNSNWLQGAELGSYDLTRAKRAFGNVEGAG